MKIHLTQEMAEEVFTALVMQEIKLRDMPDTVEHRARQTRLAIVAHRISKRMREHETTRRLGPIQYEA